ncbi:hypothetical protein GQ464_007445 [Rhodocaloribacter litoris]|uniref:hypothetical protein n=1 Tax=Rhodocaloribacter litoris TaxID=2558931 RepID=UPI00142457D2|nr:hypothetical protein [Rhodocaloribacter litoris]QXD16763.1 hypothetical protein GQ464_007445 [Rhodocaloribacter litoris]
MVTHKEEGAVTQPWHVAEVVPAHMFGVGGPVYDPPYETPLEDELAWHLVKYLRRPVRLHSQVRVPTPCGVFWVDFVLEHRGRYLGIECGALEEEVDERQERYRDALIMGTGAFEVLYRFRGEDLFHHMEDLLYLLAREHPALFTERALINLERLASPAARAAATAAPGGFAWPPAGDSLAIRYPEADEDAAAATLRVKRLRLKCATDWVRDHDAALAEYGARPMARTA